MNKEVANIEVKMLQSLVRKTWKWYGRVSAMAANQHNLDCDDLALLAERIKETATALENKIHRLTEPG